MPQKRVSALAALINAARLIRGGSETITSVTNDSRKVRPGSLYAALPGGHVDGHDFIGDAVEAGASAILCQRPPASLGEAVALFQTDEPRFALSEISDAFFDYPSRKIDVIGVTGTDGKTTTVYFIHQLLDALGLSSAFLSTAGADVNGSERDNMHHQSTPEAPEVHRLLHEMVNSGRRFAVLESTSHGLSERTCRLAHVRYRSAVFTNLSHEHLEFHGSYEQYRHDKGNLFRALDTGCYACSPPDTQPRADAFGVVNAGARESEYFASQTESPVFRYGFAGRAVHAGEDARAGTATDARAEHIRTSATGSRFDLTLGGATAEVLLPLPGEFNVENALAAALTVSRLTDAAPGDIADACAELQPVRGRMAVILQQPFAVVVDYAHTPGSFERVLPFFREQTTGKLITVFGSAGQRDVEKRAIQGGLADSYADIIVLADEDPRNEPSMRILDEIAAGCPGRTVGMDLFKIPDRREAIGHALGLARAGDTVLLLGKGHERSIIGPEGPSEWDEESVAREELRRLGL